MVLLVLYFLASGRKVNPALVRQLPGMAKRLELSLYRSAASLEEYLDETTLKRRLQDIALSVAARCRQAQQRQAIAERRRQAYAAQVRRLRAKKRGKMYDTE